MGGCYFIEITPLLDPLLDDAAGERLGEIKDYYDARKAQHDLNQQDSPYKPLVPSALYLTPEEWRKLLDTSAVARLSPFASPEGGSTNNIDCGGRAGRNFAPERANDAINVFEVAVAHVRELQGQGRRVIVRRGLKRRSCLQIYLSTIQFQLYDALAITREADFRNSTGSAGRPRNNNAARDDCEGWRRYAQVGGWPSARRGLWGPRGLPADQVARLNAAVNAAVNEPANAQRMAGVGLTPLNETPQAFADLIAAEIPRNRALVAAARIQAE